MLSSVVGGWSNWNNVPGMLEVSVSSAWRNSINWAVLEPGAAHMSNTCRRKEKTTRVTGGEGDRVCLLYVSVHQLSLDIWQNLLQIWALSLVFSLTCYRVRGGVVPCLIWHTQGYIRLVQIWSPPPNTHTHTLWWGFTPSSRGGIMLTASWRLMFPCTQTGTVIQEWWLLPRSHSLSPVPSPQRGSTLNHVNCAWPVEFSSQYWHSNHLALL